MMRYFKRRLVRWSVAASLLAGHLAWASGCATLAHRNCSSRDSRRAVTTCDRRGEVCPWLIGDALLLIPGLVPGVIAFVVDFSTGEWQHDGYSAAGTVTVSDRNEE